MGKKQVITYYAATPLNAEHPVGSGTVVHYEPGEVVPAIEWGRAETILLEAQKIFQTVTVVDTDGEEAPAPKSVATLYEELNPLVDETVPVEEFSYPVHEGAGWYTLSDGSRVRGKEDAYAAEAALGGENE